MTQNKRNRSDGKNIDYYLITYEQNKVGDKYGGDGVSDPRPHNPVADQQAGQQEKQVLRVHILYNNHPVLLYGNMIKNFYCHSVWFLTYYGIGKRQLSYYLDPENPVKKLSFAAKCMYEWVPRTRT